MNTIRMRTGIFLLFLIGSTACSSNQKITSKNFDFGHVEKGNYQNDFFGLTMKINEGWVPLSEETLKRSEKEGKKYFDDNEKLKEIVKEEVPDVANILQVMERKLGTPGFNSSLIITVYNMKGKPIKTGNDYLKQAAKDYKTAGIDHTIFDDEYKKVSLDGQTFYTMNSEVRFKAQVLRQKQYVSVMNDFALNISLNYLEQQQLQELEKMIKTVRFN